MAYNHFFPIHTGNEHYQLSYQLLVSAMAISFCTTPEQIV